MKTIKSIKKIGIALLTTLAFLVIGYMLCDSPKVGNDLIRDAKKYLQVNSFVQRKLEERFVGFLPTAEQVNVDTAQYYYSYKCAIVGEPNFLICLKNSFDDEAAFDKEIERLEGKSFRTIITEDSQNIYIGNNVMDSIEMYVDNKIYDGVSFFFEIAVADSETKSITYLSALQQDSNDRPAGLLDLLDAIQRQGDGLREPK